MGPDECNFEDRRKREEVTAVNRRRIPYLYRVEDVAREIGITKKETERDADFGANI